MSELLGRAQAMYPGASEHIWLTKRRLQSDYMQDIERQPMAASLQHDRRADGSINDYKKPTVQRDQRNNNDDDHQQQEAVSTTSKGVKERKNVVTQHWKEPRTKAEG
jgi:hypothetical protein